MDNNGVDDDDDSDGKSRWQVIIKEPGLAWLMPVSGSCVAWLEKKDVVGMPGITKARPDNRRSWTVPRYPQLITKGVIVAPSKGETPAFLRSMLGGKWGRWVLFPY